MSNVDFLELLTEGVEVRTAGDLWKALQDGKKSGTAVSKVSMRPAKNRPKISFPKNQDQKKWNDLDYVLAAVDALGGEPGDAMRRLIGRAALNCELNRDDVIRMPLAEFRDAISEANMKPGQPGQGKPKQSADDKESTVEKSNDVGKSKRGTTQRKPTVNERMTAELAVNLEMVKGWSAQEWANHLGCAKSTVIDTRTWKSLSLLRQQVKAEKRRDRRGTKPV